MMIITVRLLLLMVSLFIQSTNAVPPVIISSPIDANVSLGSTVTFSCAVERADFIVWFVNGTLNAEHNPFDGTVTLVRQQGIELVKELQLEASLLLNNSEISCTAGNVQAELVSSSRARVLIQGVLAAVEGLSASETPSSLQVSWAAPYSLAGVAILSYNVTVSGVHTGVTTALTNSTSITLDMSTTCDNYTISVVPTNAVGNGQLAVTTVNNLQEPTIDASSIVTEISMKDGFPQVNISLKVTHNCQGDLNDYVETKYNGLTDRVGPFSSTDGRIEFTVDSLPQNRQFPLLMRVENVGGISSQRDVPISTYDVQSMDAIYDRQQNAVCVTCTFMTRSIAAGCAAKIINVNETSEVTLRVSRTSSEQQISGCAPNLNAGQYRVEVFDVEASGQLAQTAAIVMNLNEGGSGGTPQPTVPLPSTAVRSSQTPTRATIPDTPPSQSATVDEYAAIRYAAIGLSTTIIALCIAIAIVILCYVYKQRMKQSRPVSSRRHSISTRSRSRQSNEYEDHPLPALQTVRQLPTVQLSNSVNQPVPSSHESTEEPALPPRLYHGGHLDLDVPSVVGQSTTDLESVSGWLRAQEPNRSNALEDQYLSDEHSPAKAPSQELATSAKRRPREDIPWYAAGSADVNGPLLLREEDEEDEGPPPYEVVTVTPRKISTQSTVSTPQREAGSMTYAELDFSQHSQRRTSLSSTTNSRTQLLLSTQPPAVDYAVVRNTKKYHRSQYATVNSLV